MAFYLILKNLAVEQIAEDAVEQIAEDAYTLKYPREWP